MPVPSTLFGLSLEDLAVDIHDGYPCNKGWIRSWRPISEEDLQNIRFITCLIHMAAERMNLEFSDAARILAALHIRGAVDVDKILTSLAKTDLAEDSVSSDDIIQATFSAL